LTRRRANAKATKRNARREGLKSTMPLEIDRATREPVMPPLSKPPAPASPPREPAPVASPPDAADAFGVTAALGPLVEFCVSERTPTPLRIGLVGPAGAGKSFALGRLSAAIADLGARGPGAGVTRPHDIVVATLDAAGLAVESEFGFDPASALAASVFVALESGRDGANYAALAEEAVHGAGDPRRAAAAASERQDELARQLDAERAAREELEAKRARLGEALIYDTPGSRVDAMIRSNRGAIEARLRRFGYVGDDMAKTFRDLIYDQAGAGAGSKIGIFLRSIWSFRGQFTLLLIAIVAALAAAGLARLRAAADNGVLDSFGSTVVQAEQMIVAHEDWLQRGVSALYAIAVLAVFVNLWRATGFTALLIRGLRLLAIDIRERRAELDATAARLEKRIATLTSEAQSAAQRADSLMKRAGGSAPAHRGPGPAFLKTLHSPAKAARDFFAELSRLMGPGQETPKPKRIVLAIDNLETLPAASALRLLGACGALLGPGMSALVACDPERLSPADPRRVSRDAFDLVFNLEAYGAAGSARLAARVIAEGGRGAGAPTAPKPLAEPLAASETAMLAAVAPLIDGGPAALKRMHGAYRLARTADAPRPLIAVMVAALQSSRNRYVQAIEAALDRSSDRFETPIEPLELHDALETAAGAMDGRFDRAAVRAALAAARLWTPPLER
jgi:hypothetical protein